MALLGYTRVSTSDQDARLQVDALREAGVLEEHVYSDVTSGAKSIVQRPGMKQLEKYARDGDTIVVWRIDRLGRSLLDVLQTVERLSDRGISVRSLQDGIDPSTPAGKLMLGMLGTLCRVRARPDPRTGACRRVGGPEPWSQVRPTTPGPDAGARQGACRAHRDG